MSEKENVLIEAFQAINRRADEIEAVASSVPERVAFNIRQRAEAYRNAAVDMLHAMQPWKAGTK